MRAMAISDKVQARLCHRCVTGTLTAASSSGSIQHAHSKLSAPETKPLAASRLPFFLDLAGVAVFAVSGALAAGRVRLDLFGVLVLAAVTAIGGGTCRDLLLNRPVFWITRPIYLYVILATALLTFVGSQWVVSLSAPLLFADALGLGLFAMSGAEIAEEQRRAPLVIVVMGTMSGVAGGVVRDILSGVAPVLFRRDIYATAAVAGISAYLLAQRMGLDRRWAFCGGIALTVGVRLAALEWNWQLPVFHIG
jgi:uncharacterized membrane protein YeiH